LNWLFSPDLLRIYYAGEFKKYSKGDGIKLGDQEGEIGDKGEEGDNGEEEAPE
jgi:hypothetical protein